jgi:hypothetical protein
MSHGSDKQYEYSVKARFLGQRQFIASSSFLFCSACYYTFPVRIYTRPGLTFDWAFLLLPFDASMSRLSLLFVI